MKAAESRQGMAPLVHQERERWARAARLLAPRVPWLGSDIDWAAGFVFSVKAQTLHVTARCANQLGWLTWGLSGAAVLWQSGSCLGSGTSLFRSSVCTVGRDVWQPEHTPRLTLILRDTRDANPMELEDQSSSNR